MHNLVLEKKIRLATLFFLIFFQQKARDNRAALRINKVQMSNDSMKRQQQQDSIDPSSRIDSDLFKDPLKQRESEHEQEWKFRQVRCIEAVLLFFCILLHFLNLL